MKQIKRPSCKDSNIKCDLNKCRLYPITTIKEWEKETGYDPQKDENQKTIFTLCNGFGPNADRDFWKWAKLYATALSMKRGSTNYLQDNTSIKLVKYLAENEMSFGLIFPIPLVWYKLKHDQKMIHPDLFGLTQSIHVDDPRDQQVVESMNICLKEMEISKSITKNRNALVKRHLDIAADQKVFEIDLICGSKLHRNWTGCIIEYIRTRFQANYIVLEVADTVDQERLRQYYIQCHGFKPLHLVIGRTRDSPPWMSSPDFVTKISKPAALLYKSLRHSSSSSSSSSS